MIIKPMTSKVKCEFRVLQVVILMAVAVLTVVAAVESCDFFVDVSRYSRPHSSLELEA